LIAGFVFTAVRSDDVDGTHDPPIVGCAVTDPVLPVIDVPDGDVVIGVPPTVMVLPVYPEIGVRVIVAELPWGIGFGETVIVPFAGWPMIGV
jgi:hypothetical protein